MQEYVRLSNACDALGRANLPYRRRSGLAAHYRVKAIVHRPSYALRSLPSIPCHSGRHLYEINGS